jgi:hypothetical protein
MFQPESTPTSQLINTEGSILESPPTGPTTPQPVSLPTTTTIQNCRNVHRSLEFTGLGSANYNKPNPHRVGLACQKDASPQMLALGELEFRKAFLILSYLGRLISDFFKIFSFSG